MPGIPLQKNMGYANYALDGSSGTNNMLQNPYNPHTEWSLLPQDVRHSLSCCFTFFTDCRSAGGKYFERGLWQQTGWADG